MQSATLEFEPLRLPADVQRLRSEVRDFIQSEIAAGSFNPDIPTEDWDVHKAFAKKVASRGWIGLTWPRQYGGQERSFLDRFVVNEEMLAANAPTSVYFTADRQSGPTLIKYASERTKSEVLPKIIVGEACFCIGMSEPDSGSDLFAAKCKATRAPGGWKINGSKTWTTNAHHADYMIGLFRTSPPTTENRRHGLTSFLVDMKTPGITCNLIHQMSGIRDFNEVVFDDAFIPDERLIGEVDGAWKQATTELAYERSGPERFLETFAALRKLVELAGDRPDPRLADSIGRLVAELHSLRRMSVSIAGMLEAGREPVSEAAIVKDLGTLWEQELPQRVRHAAAFVSRDTALYDDFEHVLQFTARIAPKLTIQGGTTEILRGVIARGLGLR
ncbi:MULTISPECIES: acyl-CoA dehydrogenase family protein [unclassified Chelatococcus]|uniref:acyl-CoA dehydrogenase family protein n=1 Tax=unclassified Chelatococcus TaxID=2638111 RepID=UPI001BCF915F|nr:MULTISPECIES: acyl-CoA dehydrogenase family protein [unclassified Chelatococcus]MBS7701394.1 acyl-CoA dehydrogenase family protein [Chelatococcus sp. YT9]MBX3557474.1 acyl-CoA dehydrogenase family protein [Chelatococcus sp.]